MIGRKGLTVLASGIVLASIGIAGSSASFAASRPPTGTLTVVIGNDIDTLDPAAQVTASVMAIEQMMVEELTNLDSKGNAAPELATKWEQAKDGMSWTFWLRKGVKFTDGTPLTAKAVKYSLDRINNGRTFKANPNAFAVISRVQALSGNRVRINLKQPYQPLPLALTLPIAGITSPSSWTVSPNTPTRIVRPIGTGPYMYVAYTPGDRIVMTANPNYWGKKASYATQQYMFVPEAASRYALFRSGQANVAVNPPATNAGDLQRSGDLRFSNSAYVIQIQYNNAGTTQPLLRNKTVRQALSYAIDRQALIKNVLFGAGRKLTGIIPATDPGYCPVPNYEYNPTKAKQMLASAGAARMSLHLVSPQGRYPQDFQVAQAVAGFLREVGVNVTLDNPTDWSTYLPSVVVPADKAKNDAHLLGWGALFGDASQALLQFRSEQIPPNGYNSTYYSNRAYDTLVAKGDADPNPKTRAAAYCKAQKMVFDDAPVIWLYQELDPIAVSSKVTGVTSSTTGTLITAWAAPKR